jgi:hypothetical protein
MEANTHEPPIAASSFVAWLGCGLFATQVAAECCKHVLESGSAADFGDWQVQPWVVVAQSRLTALGAISQGVGIVVFLTWLYAVAKYANALERGLNTPPIWCVGWFFVPFANLFMPYRAMCEIAVALDPTGSTQPPSSVFLWWAFLVAGTVLQVLRRVAAGWAEADILAGTELAGIVLHSGAVLALFVVTAFIQRGQDHWAGQSG